MSRDDGRYPLVSSGTLYASVSNSVEALRRLGVNSAAEPISGAVTSCSVTSCLRSRRSYSSRTSLAYQKSQCPLRFGTNIGNDIPRQDFVPLPPPVMPESDADHSHNGSYIQPLRLQPETLWQCVLRSGTWGWHRNHLAP